MKFSVTIQTLHTQRFSDLTKVGKRARKYVNFKDNLSAILYFFDDDVYIHLKDQVFL